MMATAYPQERYLPDEIIYEILRPTLQYPYDDWCYKPASAPFIRQESSSSLIIVSKQWCRVGTKLLYHTVVLRSQPQARALGIALSKDKSGSLGSFVARMRVEGSFGASMYTILKNASNIESIYISFDLKGVSSVTGLLKGFKCIRPRHLVVAMEHSHINNAIRALVDGISEEMERADHWPLECVVLPCAIHYLSNITRLLTALGNLSTIKSVETDTLRYLWRLETLTMVASNPNLQLFKVRPRSSWPSNYGLPSWVMTLPPQLKGLILEDNVLVNNLPGGTSSTALSPTPEPQNPSHLHFDVFLTNPHGPAALRQIWRLLLDPTFDNFLHGSVTRLGLVMLSKRVKDICYDLLFERVNFTERNASALASVLEDPQHGSLVHTFCCRCPNTRRDRTAFQMNFVAVLKSMPNLQTLVTSGITMGDLQLLSTHGSTSLTVLKCTNPESISQLLLRKTLVTFIRTFRHLTTLTFSCDIRALLEDSLPELSFPTLKYLAIGAPPPVKKDAGLLSSFKDVSMPSLERFDIGYYPPELIPFLERNGKRIKRLSIRDFGPPFSLSVVPALADLLVGSNVKDFRYHSEYCLQGDPRWKILQEQKNNGHKMLRRIEVKSGLMRRDLKDGDGWTAFVEETDWDAFPSLESIELQDVCWPINQLDLTDKKKSNHRRRWPAWSAFFDRKGICLTDGKGAKWQGRLGF
ncbi:hypothetical protein DL96DRAFT_239797 [Flagelloscypha sp. PMI_526]|nr:hypothetical protein DL96DRAFT_239797 [Flagelloscypha sp. PMI_526]